ncbi:hypothetical protein pdul_cds_107 [Pandoravirus dulcis]|uniref:Uncharacterized protein n=1 Tax=Pandoravirus dulcis TaxID=1349409 RepID=A0A291AU57_9VIRU|nr:hypothetical protein pdul_cds_107 [Pandoravirus dulcis]ATE82466.1 hypothetical protein pdul_cds_107 [Pandoravirus dulcis]
MPGVCAHEFCSISSQQPTDQHAIKRAADRLSRDRDVDSHKTPVLFTQRPLWRAGDFVGPVRKSTRHTKATAKEKDGPKGAPAGTAHAENRRRRAFSAPTCESGPQHYYFLRKKKTKNRETHGMFEKEAMA